MINIQKAEKRHIDIILEFVCDLEQESFARNSFNKIYDMNISNPANIYLIAFDPEPIGFVTIQL
jgi:(aminoalkyl)phosphonate N-acetyltransferase